MGLVIEILLYLYDVTKKFALSVILSGAHLRDIPSGALSVILSGAHLCDIPSGYHPHLPHEWWEGDRANGVVEGADARSREAP